MVTKKDFIRIANQIIAHNREYKAKDMSSDKLFQEEHLQTLAVVFKAINPAFKPQRWRDYVSGLCGPNGGYRKGR